MIRLHHPPPFMKYRPLFLLILIALSVFAWASPAAAQGSAPPAKEEITAAAHSKSLWEQIKEGGWVMVPIGIISVLTLYLIADGVLRTGQPRTLPPIHVNAIKSLFRQGDYVGAYNYCKKNPSAFTNVCR